MKKKLFVVTVAAALLLGLIGCGAKTTCDFCGEEKHCETKTVMDGEFHICEDCINEMETAFN